MAARRSVILGQNRITKLNVDCFVHPCHMAMSKLCVVSLPVL